MVRDYIGIKSLNYEAGDQKQETKNHRCYANVETEANEMV